MSEIVPVPTDQLDYYWPKAAPHIERALDKFEEVITLEDLFEDVKAKDRQLWVIVKDAEIIAAILTYIYDYKGKRTGILSHCGGSDFKSWVTAVNPIGEFFKSEGCDRFECTGRKGWARFLKDFSSERIVYEKRL